MCYGKMVEVIHDNEIMICHFFSFIGFTFDWNASLNSFEMKRWEQKVDVLLRKISCILKKATNKSNLQGMRMQNDV